MYGSVEIFRPVRQLEVIVFIGEAEQQCVARSPPLPTAKTGRLAEGFRGQNVAFTLAVRSVLSKYAHMELFLDKQHKAYSTYW